MKRQFPLTPSPKTPQDRFDVLNLAVLAMQWRTMARSVERGLTEARKLVGDPRAQTETKAFFSELTGASRRVQKVGVTEALSDKLVAKQLSRASRHAANALDVVRRRRRRQAWRRAVALTVGAGLAAGSAYAARKTQARVAAS
jgi:hypothetical protein